MWIVSYKPNRLRCDRTLPACSNCRSRPDVNSCEYVSSNRPSVTPSNTTTAPENLDIKLERLESLILGFTGLQAVPDNTTPATTSFEGAHENNECAPINLTPPSSGADNPPVPPAGNALWATLMDEVISPWLFQSNHRRAGFLTLTSSNSSLRFAPTYATTRSVSRNARLRMTTQPLPSSSELHSLPRSQKSFSSCPLGTPATKWLTHISPAGSQPCVCSLEQPQRDRTDADGIIGIMHQPAFMKLVLLLFWLECLPAHS